MLDGFRPVFEGCSWNLRGKEGQKDDLWVVGDGLPLILSGKLDTLLWLTESVGGSRVAFLI